MNNMDTKGRIKLQQLLGLKQYFFVFVGTFLLNITKTALTPPPVTVTNNTLFGFHYYSHVHD